MVSTWNEAELGGFLQASLPDCGSQGHGDRNRGKSLCRSFTIFMLASLGRMLKRWFTSTSSLDLAGLLRRCLLHPAWKRIAEGCLLPQLFLIIPADFTLLPGSHLFSIGISSETKWILWTIVSKTFLFFLNTLKISPVGGSYHDRYYTPDGASGACFIGCCCSEAAKGCESIRGDLSIGDDLSSKSVSFGCLK